jgi:hypothetical protein
MSAAHRFVPLALLLAASLILGCGQATGPVTASTSPDPPGSPAPHPPGPAPVEPPYLIATSDDWKLARAHRASEATVLPPSEEDMAWWADYSRSSTTGSVTHVRRIRLSVHHTALADKRDTLALGFSFTPTSLPAHGSALMGNGSDPDSPAIVLFEPRSGWTAMTLSYERPAADLAEWTGTLSAAGEEEWKAQRPTDR